MNRVGRTARIASSGQSLCFIMPQERAYVKHLREKHDISMSSLERFDLLKQFQKKVKELNESKDIHFKLLKNIEDPDE